MLVFIHIIFYAHISLLYLPSYVWLRYPREKVRYCKRSGQNPFTTQFNFSFSSGNTKNSNFLLHNQLKITHSLTYSQLFSWNNMSLPPTLLKKNMIGSWIIVGISSGLLWLATNKREGALWLITKKLLSTCSIVKETKIGKTV